MPAPDLQPPILLPGLIQKPPNPAQSSKTQSVRAPPKARNSLSVETSRDGVCVCVCDVVVVFFCLVGASEREIMCWC
ncbi:hypothetical protein KC19_1G247700 [Ceratodon purpureus]|uniref:Uncharacterized protein n=1 Tax=Ceratodon purpureus TaxID=3225 RepID=A0A8T0JA48_CERPU|nr:hypothetical protein KC19_1G247700 [Ceratodon purpureus]